MITNDPLQPVKILFDKQNTAILGKAKPCFPLDCLDIYLLLGVYSGCTLLAHGPF